MTILSKKEVCYVVLGHQIDPEDFELSFSSKSRCQKLAEAIINANSDKYFVLFMGLGRLQGKCKLSISECMFNYFKKEYFFPKNFFIEKQSLDTVGDAIFSKIFLNKKKYNKRVTIITSDWHLKRCKCVFKKIYDQNHNLSFLVSNEINALQEKEKKMILQKEENSLKLFNENFEKFNPRFSNPFLYLKNNHDCYENLVL